MNQLKNDFVFLFCVFIAAYCDHYILFFAYFLYTRSNFKMNLICFIIHPLMISFPSRTFLVTSNVNFENHNSKYHSNYIHNISILAFVVTFGKVRIWFETECSRFGGYPPSPQAPRSVAIPVHHYFFQMVIGSTFVLICDVIKHCIHLIQVYVIVHDFSTFYIIFSIWCRNANCLRKRKENIHSNCINWYVCLVQGFCRYSKKGPWKKLVRGMRRVYLMRRLNFGTLTINLQLFRHIFEFIEI